MQQIFVISGTIGKQKAETWRKKMSTNFPTGLALIKFICDHFS